MKKKIGCMLLSASFGLSFIARAEKDAPKIEKQIENVESSAPAETPVPIALQHPHPEAVDAVEAPARSPTASNESYKSPISHGLEAPSYADYVDAIQTGDKTSAPIENSNPKVATDE